MRKSIFITVVCFLFLSISLQPFISAYENSQNQISQNEKQTLSTDIQNTIIYNPYANIDFETINHYKANLHTHTTQSDGSGTPSEVIYHYHEIGGYAILAITDHSKNTWPWNNWINESPSASSTSSEYYPDLQMLSISGNEMSLGHHRGSLLNDYPYGGFFPAFAFWYIQHHNGLSMFNHPGRYQYSVEWYQRYFDAFNDVVLGIEVYNQGDRYPDDRDLWDKINKARPPNDLIWGFSNDDMHTISKHAFRNYQHFLMEELSESEFREAMIQGAFYFSYEPKGTNSEISTYGKAMTPKLLNLKITRNIITFTSDNQTQIKWYDQDSNIIGTDTAIDVTSIESNFIRAVLINEYGITYTQPFGIEITS